MRVYLDNNILIDIENGRWNLEKFLNIKGIEYYYSNAHISELLNAEHYQYGLKEKRLATIENLCGSNYLSLVEPTKISVESISPYIMYERVKSADFVRKHLNMCTSEFNPNRTGTQDELDINGKEMGNCGPDEIFDKIEQTLQREKHYGIHDYLELAWVFNLNTKYVTLFNLLDIVGYRKDKSNVARLYDSFHTCYAQECNVLVSDDVRMRAKAEAVYHYLNVATRVMSAKSFLDLFT